MLSRISLLLVVLLLLPSTALARSIPTADLARSFPAPPVGATAAVVMDATNGDVLYSRNAHMHRPIASTTKIMTGLLALQQGALTDRITVPKAAFNYEYDATVMGLHPGQTVTLKDLLYGLLLPSGADAANTIAIHYAGSEAAFVREMNNEAKALNMHDTHYNDAHGLTAANNYSSAYDLAILGQYVSYNADFMKIAGTKYYKWGSHTLVNVNRPLYWYPGVDGIKPGFTNEAGICQVLDAQRGGRHIVVSILNTPNLVVNARNLLNFGLRDYTWVPTTLWGDGPDLALTGADGGGSYHYFVASGHYVRGKFWNAYVANGGFAVLGYPRTEQFTDGKKLVQYFQNGELAQDPRTNAVIRLALGVTAYPPTPTPTPKITPTPTPTRTPTPTPTPHEGTVVVGTKTLAGTPTPATRPKPTATATPRPTVAPPPPPPSDATIARMFAHYAQLHARMLGKVIRAATKVSGYTLQMFSYGALAYDPSTHAVSILPMGDRILSQRHYLSDHPGNVYPAGFASGALLKAIGWLPGGLASQVHVLRSHATTFR